ncbi:hypothetical protein JCM10207_003487 [Rhodosporidiobolus poonsookiae]
MQPAPADTALPPVPLRRTSLSDGRPSRLPPLPSHSARPPTTQRAAAQPRKPEDLEPEDAPRGEAREPTQPPDSSSYDASILRFASAPLTQPALDLSPTSTRASPPSPLAPSPPAPHSPTFDLSESQLAKIEQLARQSKSYISVAQAVGCTRAEVVEGVRELVRQGRLSAKSHPKPVETSASRKVAASPAPAPPPPPARGEGEALPPQEPLLEPPPDPAVFLARRPSPFLSPAPPSPESLPASLEPLHAASSLIALSPIAVVPLSTVSAHPALATASRRPDAAAAADQPAKLGPKSEEGAEPTPGVEKKTGVWTDEETDLLLHLYKRGIAREDISTLLQRKSRHVGDRLKRLVSYGYLDTFSWDATRPSDLECASACAEEFLAAAAAEKSARSPSAASSGHETYWQYEAPGKELTAEQLDLIARMKTEGASKGEIAERVGCRVKALVTAYALLGKDARFKLPADSGMSNSEQGTASAWGASGLTVPDHGSTRQPQHAHKATAWAGGLHASAPQDPSAPASRLAKPLSTYPSGHVGVPSASPSSSLLTVAEHTRTSRTFARAMKATVAVEREWSTARGSGQARLANAPSDTASDAGSSKPGRYKRPGKKGRDRLKKQAAAALAEAASPASSAERSTTPPVDPAATVPESAPAKGPSRQIPPALAGAQEAKAVEAAAGPDVDVKAGRWTDGEIDLLIHLHKHDVTMAHIATVLKRARRAVKRLLDRLVASAPITASGASRYADLFPELTSSQLDIIARSKINGASRHDIAVAAGCPPQMLHSAYAILAQAGRLPDTRVANKQLQAAHPVPDPPTKAYKSPSPPPPDPRPAKRARIVPPPPPPFVPPPLASPIPAAAATPAPSVHPTSTAADPAISAAQPGTLSTSPSVSTSPAKPRPDPLPPPAPAPPIPASTSAPFAASPLPSAVSRPGPSTAPTPAPVPPDKPFPFRSVAKASASARRFVELLDEDVGRERWAERRAVAA